MSSAILSPSCKFSITPSEPGIIGHLAAFAAALALVLSPSSEIACDEGPMKFILQLSQIDEKFEFSLRKP